MTESENGVSVTMGFGAFRELDDVSAQTLDPYPEFARLRRESPIV